MIIIQGSSRAIGNSSKVSNYIAGLREVDVVHLAEHQIADFSYDGPGNDDFEKIIDNVIKHDSIVLLTPVYWYTMSGRLKTFLDRISDLLKWNKELGRKLRGKELFVISCSASDDAPDQFKYPFVLTADYLGMKFKSYIHTTIENSEISLNSKSDLKKIYTTK